MTTCHLVTDGEATLLGDIDLDALENARLELVALRHLVDFLFHGAGQRVEVVACDNHEREHLFLEFVVARHELGHRGHLGHVDGAEILFGVGLAFADEEFVRFVVHHLAGGLAAEEFEQVFAAGILDLVDLGLEIGADLFDGLLVLFLALLVALVLLAEDAGFEHHALHSRRSLEGRITHVAGLLAEDGAEQTFFRRKFGFALRGHLAHEDIVRTDFGTDADNAVLVEVTESVFADVRNFAGKFFRTALRFAHVEFVFLDVDGSEGVLDGEFFGDDNGVFVVVAVPREEADQDVLAEGKFTVVGRHAVGQHVASLDEVAHIHDRLLVHAGILVRALELAEHVFVNRILAEEFVVFAEAGKRHEVAVDHVAALHRDVAGVNEGDLTVVLGTDNRTRVEGGAAFEAGTHHRGFRTEQRHRLALHVRTHQRAVGVIVFEERDEASGHGHNLHRSHVHEVDAFDIHVADINGILTEDMRVFALVADDDVFFLEAVVVGELGRSRSHLERVFFVGGEERDKVGNDLFDGVASLDVVGLAVEVIDFEAVLEEVDIAIRIGHLEHLVREDVEQVALAVVEVHADAVHFLAGKFLLRKEEVRIVHESLEDAEVPLDFGELENLAACILEVDEAHDTVRSLDESVVVHDGIGCEGVDKTDVRAFRSLDRAEAAVVRVVNVTDFEACAFAGKATGTESGETTLVGKFRKRVHLVHELRELAGTKERLDHGTHGTRIHEVARSRLFVLVMQREVLADNAGHAGEAHGNLVGEEFAHGTRAAVAQVVDIVLGVSVFAIVEAHHVFDDGEEVGLAHRRAGGAREFELLVHVVLLELFADILENFDNLRRVDLGVQAVTADFAQVVLARVVQEDRIKVVFGSLQVRSFVLLLVRNGVDGTQGVFAGLSLVGSERVVDEEVFFFLGEKHELLDAAFAEAFELAVIDDGVRLDDDFAGGFVDHVIEDNAVDKHANAVFVELLGFFGDIHLFGLLVEEVQNVLGRLEADATEHGGGRNLLLAVDDDIEHVAFDVELDPCATMRNDTALVIGMAVGLEFFVEAHTGRAVQLRHDHAFGTVHDERAVLGHDREFADKDIVLDFFLELGIFAVLLENAEGESRVELHVVGKPTLTAFGDAVFRYSEVILFVFQGKEPVRIGNREDVLEDALQARIQPLFLRDIGLQKLFV